MQRPSEIDYHSYDEFVNALNEYWWALAITRNAKKLPIVYINNHAYKYDPAREEILGYRYMGKYDNMKTLFIDLLSLIEIPKSNTMDNYEKLLLLINYIYDFKNWKKDEDVTHIDIMSEIVNLNNYPDKDDKVRIVLRPKN